MRKTFTYTNILGEEVTVEPPKKPNPLVKAFGPGPEGKNHRANWPACKKFLQKPD